MMRKIFSKPEFMEFYDKEGYEKAMKEELKELATKEGFEQGIEQGLEQGSQQRNIAIAKNMLQEQIDKLIISKVTGLSLEEIDGLQ